MNCRGGYCVYHDCFLRSYVADIERNFATIRVGESQLTTGPNNVGGVFRRDCLIIFLSVTLNYAVK